MKNHIKKQNFELRLFKFCKLNFKKFYQSDMNLRLPKTKFPNPSELLPQGICAMKICYY